MTLVPIPHVKLDLNKLPDLLGRFAWGLQKIATGVLDALAARKVQELATDLMSLAFWHEGMRQEIAQLAEGNATEKVLAGLSDKLEESEAEVLEVVGRLKAARNTWISRRFTADVAERLDLLIQLKVGDGYIRDQLAWLSKQKPGEANAQEAADLLREIQRFNDELFALHEIVLNRSERRKAPAPRSGRQPAHPRDSGKRSTARSNDATTARAAKKSKAKR